MAVMALPIIRIHIGTVVGAGEDVGATGMAAGDGAAVGAGVAVGMGDGTVAGMEDGMVAAGTADTGNPLPHLA